MLKAHRSHDDATIEMFRNDPGLAAEFLNDVLATGDEVDLMMALRYLGSAFGDEQQGERRADSGPNTVRRPLSMQGDPSLQALRVILNTMGLRLAVQPVDHQHEIAR